MPLSDLDRETQLKIFEKTTLIATTDEQMRNLLMTGKIAIIYYPVRGQELLSAAVGAAMAPGDYTLTTYRAIGDILAADVPLYPVFAEFFGKSTGACKGKGGPMHVSIPGSGVMVTTGIVGAGLPIATGFGLASKMTGDGKVTIVNFGDGATNIGAFHEAMNLAAVWDLPVVFVCQNNEYGEFTARMETQRCELISDRAAGYGMPGITASGNDAAEAYTAMKTAIDRARSGGGPTLVELKTYRFMGHVFGVDQMPYMPKEEYAAALAADPLPRFRQQLLDAGIEAAELEAIEKRVTEQVTDAINRALADGPPDPAELYRDVFAEEVTV